MKTVLRVFLASMFLVMPAASRPFAGGPPEACTAFVNVTVIPMTSAQALPGQTVLVRGGRIFQVGDSGSMRLPEGAAVIDGTGKYLMPGLADMHVHSGTREWETPDFNLFLANGVTTVRDLTQGGPVASIKKYCADINGKKRLGPTIYNAWTIWGWEPHAAETVPRIKANGYDCLKVNSYLTRSEFFHVVRLAKAAGLYTIGHVPWPLSMEDLVASGMDEISHVELLPIMLIDDPQFEALPKEKWDDEMLARMFTLLTSSLEDASGKERRKIEERLSAMIAQLKGTGVTVTTTLVCDEVIALTYNDLREIVRRPGAAYLPPVFWDNLMKGKEKNAYFRGKEKAAQLFYDLIVFSLGEIRKCGIPIVAGTDTGPSFIAAAPGFALHQELKSIVGCGYSPFAALAAATRDASKVVARMTGRDEFGTIEAGKRADLLLLAGNPLEDVAAASQPLGVMAAGDWLPRPELERLLQVRRRPALPILRAVAQKTGNAQGVLAEYERLCGENRSNDYTMSEGVLTNIGYDFLGAGRTDEAVEIFEFNRGEYPFSANVYDSLAEAYLKKGRKKAAIATYRKALAMDPNFESSIKALRELEKKNK